MFGIWYTPQYAKAALGCNGLKEQGAHVERPMDLEQVSSIKDLDVKAQEHVFKCQCQYGVVAPVLGEIESILSSLSIAAGEFGSMFDFDGDTWITICSRQVNNLGGYVVLRLGRQRLSLALERPDRLPTVVYYSFGQLRFPVAVFGWRELREAALRLDETWGSRLGHG